MFLNTPHSHTFASAAGKATIGLPSNCMTVRYSLQCPSTYGLKVYESLESEMRAPPIQSSSIVTLLHRLRGTVVTCLRMHDDRYLR